MGADKIPSSFQVRINPCFSLYFFSINFSFKIKVFEYFQCSLRVVEWCLSFHICGVKLTVMLISVLTNTANSLLDLMLSLHSRFYPQAHRCLCFYKPSLNLLEDWFTGLIKVKDEKKKIFIVLLQIEIIWQQEHINF